LNSHSLQIGTMSVKFTKIKEKMILLKFSICQDQMYLQRAAMLSVIDIPTVKRDPSARLL